MQEMGRRAGGRRGGKEGREGGREEEQREGGRQGRETGREIGKERGKGGRGEREGEGERQGRAQELHLTGGQLQCFKLVSDNETTKLACNAETIVVQSKLLPQNNHIIIISEPMECAPVT